MRTVILTTAALLLAMQTMDAAEPVFFIQISDPQLGMFAKNADSQQEEANLRFAVASINRLKPKFVVVTGDLVNKQADPVQIQRYQELIRGVDKAIPVYNAPGNHDVGNHPTKEQLVGYRKSFGKDYYSFDAGPIRGIVLDSNILAAAEAVPEESKAQEAWLRAELIKAQRDKVEPVLFQHISFFLHDPKEADQYFNIPSVVRERYLKMFHEYGVKHIFAGHYHRNEYGRDGDLEMVTTSALGMPLGPNQSGMRIVRMADGTIENRYYELGSIPHAIDPAQPLPDWPAKKKANP